MKFDEQYTKVIKLIILFIVLVIITILIKEYFTPFFIIIFMLLINHPIYKFLVKKNINKNISAIISLLIVNLSLFFIIFYFGNTLITLFQKFYIGNTLAVDNFVNNIRVLLHFDLNKAIKTLTKILNSSIILQGASITGESLIGYFIGNIATYFILVDKTKVYDLLTMLLPKDVVKNIYIKKANLKEVFKIEINLVFLTAFVTIIGFKILGVDNSIFLGIICGMLDILPYVGTIIVFIPIIIYNIIMKRYLLVIGFIALYFLIQIFREILEAKFLSNKLEIHPLVVMLSIYVGVKMFGFVGIIAGPVYCIIAKDIIYNAEEEY
ncbi:AI-2E family transporter [Clostridium chauvoei]|uniref:AI-2E family transporter n=1 Tax=Clostridium chauvoei TaxID=46867 RepID=UPI001C857AC1|nr:AI-2E family transporter [Clostridium chauvoei]MBX7326756.1 AI-2E family transporter [Clostridium chauvoei]